MTRQLRFALQHTDPATAQSSHTVGILTICSRTELLGKPLTYQQGTPRRLTQVELRVAPFVSPLFLFPLALVWMPPRKRTPPATILTLEPSWDAPADVISSASTSNEQNDAREGGGPGAAVSEVDGQNVGTESSDDQLCE